MSGLSDGTMVTISGVAYVVDGGELREATADEIAAAALSRTARRAQRQADRAQRPAGPSYHFGDIAGGDIIRSEINIRTDGDGTTIDLNAILRSLRRRSGE